MSWVNTYRLRAVCAIPLLLAAAPPARSLSPDELKSLDRAIAAERAAQGVVGLSVSVAKNGVIQWSAGFGLADLENDVPARAATMYRLGSIAKPITAVAVMQLAERGKLDLDAPVQRYVPGFPPKPWPVTPRHLLGHLSGVRNYKSHEEFASTRHYTNVLDPLKIFQEDDLLFEPGTRYSYTSYGYNLLGAVVEAASGEKYMDYVRANIFTPAGMVAIRDDDSLAVVPNRTRGYQRGNDGRLLNADLADTSNKVPGGGMIAPPEDLVRFAVAFQNDMLVRRETRETMLTRQKLKDGKPTGYGLGWGLKEIRGRAMYSHGGTQQGTRTFLGIVPAEALVVAVMCNTETADPEKLFGEIVKVLIP